MKQMMLVLVLFFIGCPTTTAVPTVEKTPSPDNRKPTEMNANFEEAGRRVCVTMYSMCLDPDENGDVACTSARFELGCGQVGVVPDSAKRKLKCVCQK